MEGFLAGPFEVGVPKGEEGEAAAVGVGTDLGF